MAEREPTTEELCETVREALVTYPQSHMKRSAEALAALTLLETRMGEMETERDAWRMAEARSQAEWRRLGSQNEHLRAQRDEAVSLLREAESVIEFVSRGRHFSQSGVYPDAKARRVNADIKTLLARRPHDLPT